MAPTNRRRANEEALYYHPWVLRWHFLSCLVCFICALTALLEYSRQTLPAGEDRTVVPQDFMPESWNSTAAATEKEEEPLLARGGPSSHGGLNHQVAITTTGSNTIARNTRARGVLGSNGEAILTSNQSRAQATPAPSISPRGACYPPQNNCADTNLPLKVAWRPAITTFVEAPVNSPIYQGSHHVRWAPERYWQDNRGHTTSTDIQSIRADGESTEYVTKASKLVPLPGTWHSGVASGTMYPTGAHAQILKALTDEDPYPGVMGHLVTESLRDGRGMPTATISTDAPALSTAAMETDAKGIPTVASTEYAGYDKVPDTSSAVFKVVLASRSQFIIFFLPMLLAALLALPIQALDTEVKLLLPFLGLQREGGCPAADSVSMRTNGIPGRLTSWRLVRRYGDPISLISDILLLCSSLLISISVETIGLKLQGECSGGDLRGCFLTPAAFQGPVVAAEVLLLTMGTLLISLGILARLPRVKIAAHPGSMAAICCLLPAQGSAVGQLRQIGLNGALGLSAWEQFDHELRTRRWSLEKPTSGGLALESRAIYVPPGQRQEAPRRGFPAFARSLSSTMVERIRDIAFLLFLLGLFIVLVYYETVSSDTPLEGFMDRETQRFGARFLFATLGVIISLYWDQLFFRVSTKDVYRRMALRPQPAQRSILASPATTVFGAFFGALASGNFFLAAVAFAGILSKFAPILLASVPFATSQTWTTHLICTWVTVAILAVMILTLSGSLLVKWPHFPVEPYTLAERMWYVCDAHLLSDFEGLSSMSVQERQRVIIGAGKKYQFGKTIGVSGQCRIGVDCDNPTI